jgi:hypothetical protein
LNQLKSASNPLILRVWGAFFLKIRLKIRLERIEKEKFLHIIYTNKSGFQRLDAMISEEEKRYLLECEGIRDSIMNYVIQDLSLYLIRRVG